MSTAEQITRNFTYNKATDAQRIAVQQLAEDVKGWCNDELLAAVVKAINTEATGRDAVIERSLRIAALNSELAARAL